MGLFDLVREEQEAKKKAEESAKKDTKDAVVEEVEKVEEDKKETDQQRIQKIHQPRHLRCLGSKLGKQVSYEHIERCTRWMPYL